MAAPHVDSVDAGLSLTRSCWRAIFRNLPDGLAFEIVSYESLVQRQTGALERMLERWGLTLVEPVEAIKDANAKYYG